MCDERINGTVRVLFNYKQKQPPSAAAVSSASSFFVAGLSSLTAARARRATSGAPQEVARSPFKWAKRPI